MEKFYKVTNEKYLARLLQDVENKKQQQEIVLPFLKENGVNSETALVSGDGLMNTSFEEKDKANINLYVDDAEYSDEINKQLKKASKKTGMRGFKKTSKILKAFQDLCIEKQMVINILETKEGDYFTNLHGGGYNMKRFASDDAVYLMIKSKYDFEPEHDGFDEINGSEFYQKLEEIVNEQTGDN